MVVRTLSVVGGAYFSGAGSRGRGSPANFGCIQTVVYAIFEKRIMASAISELYPAGCVVWYKLHGWPWWPSKVLVLEPCL